MSRNFHGRIAVAIALLLALTPAAVFAQATGAVLTGKVTDGTGAALPGVTVTLTNTATGVTQSVVTGVDGNYRTTTVSAGRYTMVAELSGFSTVMVRDLQLNVATTRQYDISLRPASVQESITVTADAPLVANSPSLGTVVSQQELENLPLNGRQFANLASLAPGTSLGVNPDPTKPGQLVVALNGGIGRNVNYVIDGGDNTDDTIGGALQNFNLEAVQEFRIQTQQYKAEFGRSTGGVLTVVTKTGTNDLGGAVYGFFRDDSLNSKTESETRANRDKTPYERKQYGASIGGPIVRDVAHFFATYDTTDRQTLFTLSPATRSIFPSLPTAVANPYDDQLVTAKATWALSPTQQVQFRYGHQDYKDVYSASPLSTPDNIGLLNSEYRSFLAGHTAQIGGSMVNDFLYQYSTFENAIRPVTDAPTMVFANGVNAGQNFNVPQTTEQIKHQFKNDLAFPVTLGGSRHDLKAGVNYIHEPTLGGSFSSGLSGRYFFLGNSLDSPITRIEVYSGFNQFSTPIDQYSVYLQDDWQITSRLQLNLGIRYDLWDGFDLDQTTNPIWQTLTTQSAYNESYLQAFRGSSGLDNDGDNWGPRLGFTYDLTGQGRHVLRGGWGLYYDFPYTNATILFPSAAVQSNFGQTYQHVTSTGILNPDGSFYRIGQPLPANQLPQAARPAPNEVASPLIEAPQSTQTSLGWSGQLSSNVGATVDLVSIRYRNMPYRFRANPIDPATGQRRFSQFGNFRIWMGDGEADYEGVNLGLRARVTNTLELQGFYTWSEATGNILAGADEFRITAAGHQPDLSAVADQSVNPLNPLCDACFGPLNTDARHRVTLSAIYRAPLAINLSGVLRYRSGFPYTEWAGIDLNGDGFAFDLPSDVPHVNTRRGDDMTQVDLRVSREFGVGGGFAIEPMVEVFNLFNADNPARFIGNRRASNFGQPTIFSGDPLQGEQRLIQLGLRVRY
ncbi:MAG TPA: TonB-dependent receptor [Thermoanaerobaculia bacterium]|nr:TonB-dependent receptor [Thermoanaerobaculia bacterium]